MAKMLSAWKQWCRLCAEEDGDEVDVFHKSGNLIDLPQTIQRFFLISVNPCDEAPTMICYTCYRFLRGLIKFADRASKVDTMFSEILFQKYNMISVDPNCLRFQYGLNDNTVEGKCERSDKSTDTTDFVAQYLHSDDNIQDCRTQLYTVIINQSDESGHDIQNENQNTEIPEIKTEKEDSVEDIEVITMTENSFPEDTITPDEDYMDEEYLEIKAEAEEGDKTATSKNGIHLKRIKTIRKFRDFQPTKCEGCDKDFAQAASFRQHLKICPLITKPSIFPCSKCDKNFPTEKRAQQHEATHLPPEMKMIYPCRFCDKKFTKSVNVTAHVKAIHIGEKPFICEECGKTFSTKGALKEHKFTHVEETPYQCSKCPKKFKNLPRLKTHEDTHNDTIYVCPHCGLQLNTKRTLQMHMVVHSDQKKYKCNYCGNEYKRSKALKNHLILHTGLRPYTCPFCDKTFANGSNCRSHKKKAHPMELAAMEAAGQKPPTTQIPKLEQLKAVAQATQPPPPPSPDHSIFTVLNT